MSLDTHFEDQEDEEDEDYQPPIVYRVMFSNRRDDNRVRLFRVLDSPKNYFRNMYYVQNLPTIIEENEEEETDQKDEQNKDQDEPEINESQ
ncbi:unnamed protein product [Caenorhabditis angaria]|uniref:Uncharacterized protein n=1 Tax=Caenorhabditis angaria TaxID=860376 RepID=A0A9P1NBM4_9PELO|nr:unnamed protein product [Caenorhabditis angaria]